MQAYDTWEQHDCDPRPDEHDYDRDPLGGDAITVVAHHPDGRWFAHNGEYATEIWFCPWCGVDLRSDE